MIHSGDTRIETFMMKHQKGFAIIKGIIAVLIATVIGAAGLTFFANWKHTKLDTSKLSVQELNRRLSSGLLPNKIVVPHPDKIDFIESHNYRDIFPVGSRLVAAMNNSKNESDELTLSYPLSWANNKYNCQNQVPVDKMMATSHFYVNRNHQLVCVDIDTQSHTKSEPIVLIEQVESMHVRFGLDTDNNGMVDQYLPPHNPTIDSASIQVIKVSLLIKTVDEIASGLNQKFYTLQDTEVGPYQDSYIRKIYTTSVELE